MAYGPHGLGNAGDSGSDSVSVSAPAIQVGMSVHDVGIAVFLEHAVGLGGKDFNGDEIVVWDPTCVEGAFLFGEPWMGELQCERAARDSPYARRGSVEVSPLPPSFPYIPRLCLAQVKRSSSQLSHLSQSSFWEVRFREHLKLKELADE